MSLLKKLPLKMLIALFICIELTSEAKTRRPVVTYICPKVDERIAVSCLNFDSALLKSDQIFARTQFTNPNSNVSIWHIWINNDQEIYRKKIFSLGGGFRAVTSVRLRGRDGKWKFQVADESGKTLETIYFVTAEGPRGMRGRLIADMKNEQPSMQPDDSKPKETALESKDSESSGHWFFNLGPRLNFTKLNSTQNANSSTAQFLSNENFGAHLGVDYFQSDFSQVSSFNLNLDSNRYKNVSGKSLNSLPSVLREVSVSHQTKNIFSGFHGDFILGLKDDFFDRASSSVDLNFSSVLLPFAGIGTDYEIAKSKANTVDLGIRFLYFFKTSNSDYLVNESKLWRFQISDRYSLFSTSDQFLTMTAFLDRQSQSTSLISRTKENIGLELFYSWEVGK